MLMRSLHKMFKFDIKTNHTDDMEAVLCYNKK